MGLLLALGPLASAAELTAGDVDDNLNFQAYSNWAGRLRENITSLPALNLTERVTVRVVDGDGAPVSRAFVTVTVAGEAEPRVALPAGTDGVLRFFPAIDANGSARQFALQASAPGGGATSPSVSLDLDSPPENRTLTLALDGQVAGAPQALDFMIVLDTTGSMADELEYLRDQLASIVANVTLEHAAVDIRFALVVYRDIGDEYVVRSFPFTSSLQSIQGDLDAQVAYNGGDFPEAMDAALGEAMAASWRGGNTARVALVVADAPPHEANYPATVERIKQARAAGIQLYALAASGVDPSAEYILRAGAALTGARYMFLTDDSGVGNAHAEPSTLCYQVTVLSNLISRVISSELAGQRVEAAPGAVLRTLGNFSAGVCIDGLADDGTPVLPYVPTAVPDGMYHPSPPAAPPATVAVTAREPTGSTTTSPAPVFVYDASSSAPAVATGGETWTVASHMEALDAWHRTTNATVAVGVPEAATSPHSPATARSVGYASPLAIGLLVLAMALAVGSCAALWSERNLPHPRDASQTGGPRPQPPVAANQGKPPAP